MNESQEVAGASTDTPRDVIAQGLHLVYCPKAQIGEDCDDCHPITSADAGVILAALGAAGWRCVRDDEYKAAQAVCHAVGAMAEFDARTHGGAWVDVLDEDHLLQDAIDEALAVWRRVGGA